jgi:hypothetical protein
MVSRLTQFRIDRLIVWACLHFMGLAAFGQQIPKKDRYEHGAISRVAEIHEVEHLEDHRIRVVFSAQEREGAQRFPITTIDRSMVKVDFTNTSSPPVDATSLLLHGSGGNDLRRALYVAFSFHRKLTGRAIEEIRSDIGQLVKDLPSEFLTVAAIAQDSARVIADVTPEKGDNINRILQQVQSLAPEGDGPALADTLCVAAERFHAWDLSKFKKSDQKALVIVSNPGDAPSTERYRGQNCWRSLLDQGVRVYNVSFGPEIGRSSFDLTNVAPESGGYVHRISGPVEMGAAIKNIIALLKNEYVIDVDAPDISLEDQPLELKIRISYHDEIFESSNFNVGFVIPSLSKVFASSGVNDSGNSDAKSKAAAESRARIYFLIIVLVVSCFFAILLYFISRYLKFRSTTVACNTCGYRVKIDHSDCPFRDADCVARLVVVSGRYAGQTIPIRRGETHMARFALAGGVTKIRGRGIRWKRHGTISLDGQKALYTPAKPGRDRLNGWRVYEPRLIGIGSVLTLGDQMLRFEVKPQFGRH